MIGYIKMHYFNLNLSKNKMYTNNYILLLLECEMDICLAVNIYTNLYGCNLNNI